jgi:mono/diheme cytochrome c family protein
MKLAIASACLLLVPLGLVAWPARQTTEPARHASGGSQKTQIDAGERAFAANCSRCHAAPMGLPPRITGTVIMHMRTRARLSRQDEQALLKYLAP